MKIPFLLLNLTFLKQKSKVRFTFGMLIFIMMVFSSSMFLVDSATPTYATFATERGGGYDLMINRRDCSTTSTTSLFDSNALLSNLSYIESDDFGSEGSTELPIAYAVNRITTSVHVNSSSYRLYGASFALETSLDIGVGVSSSSIKESLANYSELIKTGNYCAVTEDLINQKELNLGENITIEFPFGFVLNYTIGVIYSDAPSYPYGEYNLGDIIIDLDRFQALAAQEDEFFTNKSNQLGIVLKDSDQYYRVLEYQDSERELDAIANQILWALGYNDWEINFPKMHAFDAADEAIPLLVPTLIFITFSVILFLAMLVHNCLSTSVSEKIRDFGILESLGAKKKHIFWELILEGLSLGISSTILGLFASYLFNALVLIPIINHFIGDLWGIFLIFRAAPQVVGFCAGINLGVVMAVALFPARKIYQYSLIEKMTPDLLVENVFLPQNLEKRHRNRRAFIGVTMITTVILILSLLPQFFVATDIVSILLLIMVIFFIGLMGTVIFGLGLTPMFSKSLIHLFSRIKSKYRDVLVLGVFRYQRRNQLISVLVVVSFSILVFFSTFIGTLGDQSLAKSQCVVGADLSISSKSYYNFPLTGENIEDLEEVSGIISASGIVSDLDQLERGYGYLTNSTYLPELAVSLSDVNSLDFKNYPFIAVDRNFIHTIPRDRVSLQSGSILAQNLNGYIDGYDPMFDTCFSNLFNLSQPTIMISAEIADTYYISINDSVKLMFERDGQASEIAARVSCIYYSMPGIQSNNDFLEFDTLGSFMISYDLLAQNLQLAEYFGVRYTKILLKVSESADIDQIKQLISATIPPKSYYLSIIVQQEEIDGKSKILRLAEVIGLILVSLLFLMVLMGFNSSFYSVFLERQTEIKVFRVLGLSFSDLRNLFFQEMLILFIINAIIGTIIGTSLGGIFSVLTGMLFHVRSPLILAVPFIMALSGGAIFLLFLLFRRLFNRKIESHLQQRIQMEH